MATYKVLQDIEADDKFLGPLTLKQCIFAAIAIVSGYLSIFCLTKGIWVIPLGLLPVIVVSAFLAFPWGRDQPTEVWMLAKLRFWFKPRKRIWDQTGIQELVKITAPPKIEAYTGDNLTQVEVKSRLKALADTMNTRGWAIKGADYAAATAVGSGGAAPMLNRLDSTLPAINPMLEEPSTDMFDSVKAQQIDNKINDSSQRHKQKAVQNLEEVREITQSGRPAPADNFWFMGGNEAPNQPTMSVSPASIAPEPGLSPLFSTAPKNNDQEDQNFLSSIKTKKQVGSHSFSNHKNINPFGSQPNQNIANPSVTPGVNPAIIEKARNNDRTVESLAREANDNEVVVPLH